MSTRKYPVKFPRPSGYERDGIEVYPLCRYFEDDPDKDALAARVPCPVGLCEHFQQIVFVPNDAPEDVPGWRLIENPDGTVTIKGSMDFRKTGVCRSTQCHFSIANSLIEWHDGVPPYGD